MNNHLYRYMVLLGISCFVVALDGWAAEQPRFTGLIRVPPMTAPTVDGRVTSATEWQGADQVTGWVDNVLGVANPDGTKVAVGHAGEVLYMCFTCPIPEKFRLNKVVYASYALKMTAKGKDGDIFQDDYVGVYLTPPGKREVYFLGVNGAGITRDSRNGDVSWNGQWQSQQTRDDFVWTVELAIPLNQFGGAVTEDQAWGVNLAHGARQIELLEGLWAYQPAELYPMAEMRLASRPVVVSLDGLGNLSEGSLALKGQITNLGKESLDGTLEVAVRDLAGADKRVFGPEKIALALKPGEKKDLAANFDAGGPLCGKVMVTIKDAQGAILLDYGLPFAFAREVSLETRWIPTPSILQVVLDLGSPASFKKVTGGQVKVTSLDTKKMVLTQALPAFQSSLSTSDIDCTQLACGRYEVEVELKMGAATTTLKSPLVKEPNPEWLGNTVGISEKVPIPWSPLQAKGGKTRWWKDLFASPALTVSCWGRQYTFGAAGFPSQINVLGQDILAGPVRITLQRGGRTEVLPAVSCRVTGRKDTRVAFRTVAKAGGVEITADTWMEFDGFVWNTINVKAVSPAEIEALSIEIPLKKEYATLWWHPELGRGVLNDKMGAPPKQPQVSAPVNFLRLGDEERGIQFFYESLRNWNLKPGRGQELIPGEKEYLVRYHLIDQPTKLDKPLQFSLGYVALPSRPRSEVYRRIDPCGMWTGAPKPLSRERLDQAGWLFQIRAFYTELWNRHYNYFNFWNTEVYDKDFLQKFKEKSVDAPWASSRDTVSIYYNALLNDANTPEYRAYRFEWKTVPGNAPYVAPDPKTRDKTVMGSVCHQSRSYVDFQVWYMDKMVRYLSGNGKIPIHGYQDCGGHGLCLNALHGCPADGHVFVLANREWAKRVYTMYKTINPLNQLYIHTGGESGMNWCGFFDGMIEGEQFTAGYLADIVNDPSLPKNYTKILNLERYRAQCQPYAWGPERFYLTQFWQWMEKEPDRARGAMGHLWGLTLCHDTPVWAGGMPASVSRAISEVKWDDKTEFIPYWRKQTGIEVKASVSPVVASGWRCGPGSLLVMVFNDSDQTAKGEVKLDFARFGFQPGEIKCRDYGNVGLAYPDALFVGQVIDGKPVDPQQLAVQDTVIPAGAAVPVEVGRHSFKLVRFYQ